MKFPTRLSILSIGFLFLQCPISICRGADSTFETPRGGFSISVPEAWNREELPQEPGGLHDRRYSVFFSPEKVNLDGEMFQYGLAIVRELDRSGGYWAEWGDTPSTRAERYAHMIAQHEAQGVSFSVRDLGEVDRGRSFWDFEITTDAAGDSCTIIRLSASLTKKEFFHAVLVTPCDRLEERSAEIAAILESIRVRKSWRGAK